MVCIRFKGMDREFPALLLALFSVFQGGALRSSCYRAVTNVLMCVCGEDAIDTSLKIAKKNEIIEG